VGRRIRKGPYKKIKRVNILVLNMAINYWLARIFGIMEGVNSPEKARETILDDIRRTKSELNVVSCTADLVYWDDETIKAIESKLNDNPKIKFEFLMGPQMNNKSLENLAREGKIKLVRLSYTPLFSCRIVDNRDTYLSNPEAENKPKKYSWTFGNRPALEDRKRHYDSLKREFVSRPSCLKCS